MEGRSLVTILVLGVVGYLVIKRESTRSSSGGSSQTTNFQAKDPYTAAVQALTPTIQKAGHDLVSQLEDEDSDLRNRLRQHGDNVQNIGHALGISQAAGQRKRDAQRFWNAEFATRLDAERYAARVHSFLSRSDVEQWVIEQDGTLRIFYRGQKEPYVVKVPASVSQLHRIAFAMEPIVRALGAPLQRGVRIGTPFVRHDPPAFSDGNPYAQPSMTVSGVAARERDPLTINSKAKRLGQALTPKSQSILKAAGLLNQDLIPGQEN